MSRVRPLDRIGRGLWRGLPALLLLRMASVFAPAPAVAGTGVGCCAFAGPTCVGNATQAQCANELGAYYDGGSCNPETGLCSGSAAQIFALISTNRGCLENGDAAVFAIGDPITVLFEVQSDTEPDAIATILDRQPDGFVGELFRDTVQTNHIYKSTGLTVAPPTGVETLQLQATAPGAADSIDNCSFEVVEALTPTFSPTPTPTPQSGCCQFSSPAASCALVGSAAGCDGVQFLPGKGCNTQTGLCDGFMPPTPTPPIAQRQLYFEADNVHDGGQITVVINVFPPGGGAPIPITAMVTVAPGDNAEAIARKWATAFQAAAKGKVNCSVDVRATDSPNVWCVFIQCTNAISIGVDLPPLDSIPLGTAVGPNAVFPTPSPSSTKTRTPTRTPIQSRTKTSTITATATRTITGTRPATPTVTATPTKTQTDTPTATVTATATETLTPMPVRVHMDLEIYRLDGSRLPDDEGGDPDEEETLGSMVCINNDNDNHNAVFDIDERNVAGENDLIRMVAHRPSIPATGTARLVATRGGEKVRVWTSSSKTDEVMLPAELDVSELPMDFWIEGVDGSTAQRDVEFELDGPAAPGLITIPDRVDLTVVQITQTTWIGKANSLTDTDALDADPHDPHWPGALRVFPDARAVGGAARNAVRVQVTLSVEPVEPWNIFLRAFDIDDPAARDANVDPNDDGSAGTYPHTTIPYTADEDNRGAVNGHKAGELDGQDADGIATLTFPAGANQEDIDFQVTMQPGDNFRVAAVCDRTYLSQLRNRDQTDQEHIVDRNNGLAIRNADMQVTPVLTVWRRLHLERDSMAAPGALNTVSGMITDVTPGFAANTSIVTTDQALADDDQYRCPAARFPMPCRLQVGMRQFDVLDNSTGPGSALTVQNDATGAPPNNAAFTLHDDDSDDLLPTLPDIDLLQDANTVATNAFAAAYVRPIADGGGNAANDQNNLGVHLNVEAASDVAQLAAGQNTHGNRSFWVAYAQMLFQGPLKRDNDPDGEIDPATLLQTRFGTTPGFNDGSLVYRESYRDDCGGLNADPGVRSGIAYTVAHEIGHQFFAQHTDLGLMDQGCVKPAAFSDESLNRIRSVPRVGLGAEPALRRALAAEWQERLQSSTGGPARTAAVVPALVTSGLTLSIAVDKTTFIVGEPVPMHFTLTNHSSASVTGNFNLGFGSGRLAVLITPQDGTAHALISPATQVGLTEDAALQPITFAPGESRAATQLISYDVTLGGFALPSPGTYMLAATFFYDAHDTSKRVDSNVLAIAVNQPSGADADALASIDAKGLQGFLTPEAALLPLDLSADRALRAFLTMRPNSSYAPAARAALDAICKTGVDPIACAPLGCTGDCSGDGTVAIQELITGVGIALGSTPVGHCPSFDCNRTGMVTIDCLVQAVRNALTGCSLAAAAGG